DLADRWGQVWDILPAQWEKINYVLGRRRCSCCGAVNTAVPPCGQAVAVVYGPKLNAAAILPSSQGNVPVEATARMMEALLGAKVSTGFVARAHERLAQALAGAGVDDAMVAALRAEDVLCADETPVNVVDNVDDDGGVATGSPHVVRHDPHRLARPGPPDLLGLCGRHGASDGPVRHQGAGPAAC